MPRSWDALLVIPVCVIVTFYFQFSLVIGGNKALAPQTYDDAASFGAPRDIIKKNVTARIEPVLKEVTRGERHKDAASDATQDGIYKSNVTVIEPVPTKPNKEEEQKRQDHHDPDESKYRGIPFERLSSVDSFTCCGLGHRMTRLVNAAHVVSRINFALRVFWDFCGDVEVFTHFFGGQPRDEIMNVNSTGQVLRIHNEVPGYRKLVREGPKAPCKCAEDKVAFDAKFYTNLRKRFRNKAEVDSFVHSNFANHSVIGLHVRAGNGEQGDFTAKNRMINDTDSWVGRISKNLHNMTVGWTKQPLLYLATDTASMVEKFRAELAGVMNVIHFPHQRSDEGHGVFFGERGVTHNATREPNQCLNGWDAVIRDMLILSHTDVVVASRPSSFTQTLPMSLVSIL